MDSKPAHRQRYSEQWYSAHPHTSCLALNHDELWTGRPKDTVREGAPEVFVKARSLALDGKLHEAEELIEQDFLSVWSQAYMPLGDLELEFSLKGRVKDYRRSLDLEKAVAAVEFTCGQKKYKREYFASYPAKPSEQS